MEPSNLPAPTLFTIASSLSVLERFMPLWILAAMVGGVLLGRFTPGVQQAFSGATIAGVSLPIAVGLWLMMWPVLAKVRYEVLDKVLQQPGILSQICISVGITVVVAPAVMTAFAWATLPDLHLYRNGVILVGLAPCIAMVLIWNALAGGHAELCAVLVAINSILQVVLYAPMALFYLQVVSRQYLEAGLTIGYWVVARSVLVFLGVPLLAGVITRYACISLKGVGWYNRRLLPFISPLSLLALVYTVVLLFALQAGKVLGNIADVVRVTVPLLMYFIAVWAIVFWAFMSAGVSYDRSVTQAFTSSSNNFELAIAIAVSVFGPESQEALAATLGPLIEVPVLLMLVYCALWYKRHAERAQLSAQQSAQPFGGTAV